ncbi:translation initiation factor IF-2-like [Strigops habroptila]|uniref:translation initiation factor IF-2-like n=1 Tax=Strigops habroptila TaxID=2489341 RepID=UPI0011CF6E12|nr:translation initiation factor IF-2-like [Strigops habroptila]
MSSRHLRSAHRTGKSGRRAGARPCTCRSAPESFPLLRPSDATPQTKCPLCASESLLTRARKAARAAEQSAGTGPPRILAPCCFWREPQKEKGGGSDVPQHSSRPCLRARSTAAISRAASPARRGLRRAGSRRAVNRGGTLAAAAPRLPSRAAPQRSPPAPALSPGSSRSPFRDRLSASSSLSVSPLLRPSRSAASGGPEPPGSAERGDRHYPSLSRQQLTLSPHPHIPPAAAAAPKFTALRRHEVILPAPSPGRRTPLSPRRGRRPLRPASRAPPDPGAPPSLEGPAFPRFYTHPAPRRSARGGTVPRRRGCGSGVPPLARRQDGPLRPGPAFSPRDSPRWARSNRHPRVRHRGCAGVPSPAVPRLMRIILLEHNGSKSGL